MASGLGVAGMGKATGRSPPRGGIWGLGPGGQLRAQLDAWIFDFLLQFVLLNTTYL